MLEVGQKAPGFTLEDANGNQFSLKNFFGKKLVLYFYPRDNTPGCTRQANAFRDVYQEYIDRGVQVVRISKDSVKSHQKFSEKNNLPFTLLSDPTLQAIQAYGV